MPEVAESIEEATVVQWNVNVGDAVAVDETMAVLETVSHLPIFSERVPETIPWSAHTQIHNGYGREY